MFSLLNGAVLVLALLQLAHGLSMKDRFDVDTDSSDDGGCGYVTKDKLDVIINECLDLAQVGLDLVNDYSRTDEAKRLLDAYFRGPKQKQKDHDLSDYQLTAIKNTFTAVHTWIDQGGNVNGGKSNIKPWLFCHHKWLDERSMNDPALDRDGNEIFFREKGGTRASRALEDIVEYRRALAKEQEGLTVPGKAPAKVAPFWSKAIHAYYFGQKYPKGQGFCSAAGSYGATQHTTKPSTLTLCPRVFGSSNNQLSNSKIISIRSIEAKPKKMDPSMTSGQTIKDLVPSSGTLYHELFHLVLGNPSTTPREGEEYDLKGILNIEFDQAVKNPDTYLYAAVAYDYTRRSTPDGDNWKIEFYAGYTTQGKVADP